MLIALSNAWYVIHKTLYKPVYQTVCKHCGWDDEYLLYIIYDISYPPPCRQARLGVFGPSSGGLMSGICVFLRDPQPVTRATRLVFFEHVFGSYFLMTFWSPMIPQSVQVGLHVGSFLESCCLAFPIFSGVYLGS